MTATATSTEKKQLTIWKFTLAITGRQIISMPYGAKILTVQVQNGVPCLWALVTPSEGRALRGIQIYGTGHDASDAGTYIGTFQTGPLVFHVFEDKQDVNFNSLDFGSGLGELN